MKPKTLRELYTLPQPKKCTNQVEKDTHQWATKYFTHDKNPQFDPNKYNPFEVENAPFPPKSTVKPFTTSQWTVSTLDHPNYIVGNLETMKVYESLLSDFDKFSEKVELVMEKGSSIKETT